MSYFTNECNSLVWRNNGETLMLTPWGRDGIRVRSVLMGDIADHRFALLDPEDQPDVQIVIGDQTASLRSGGLTARLEMDGWHRYARISFYDREDKLLFRETPPANALSLKSRKFSPALGGDYALNVTFEGQEGERLYGMGQYQEEILDWKGCTLELAHRNSQASVPFVMSSRGYGFLWHNPAIGSVSFGHNRTTWHADATKQMDYWVTCGDTPARISASYGRATGTVPMMPEYGLGFWQCKLRYWNQEQLLSVAREYRRRGLNVDVIVCDFFHWPRMGDYRFDPEFFSDPAAMVRELDEMGIKLMVSIWPQVSLESENYAEMNRQGLLVRAEYGEQVGMRFVEPSMFFDPTNPRARKYVWQKVKKNYYDQGIRVFWLDEAEPEYGTYDFPMYRYHMGSNLQIGNIYPQMYSRLFYEGMRAEGQENPVNLVRCAWCGSQRYGALVWSGDIMSSWEDFRRQLCAGLSMGVAGIPWWTTDIGGFHHGNPEDPAFRELLIRWFQWGAYCPVMRLHGDRQPSQAVYRANGERVLSSGADNEVWSFGEEAYPILRKYMARREQLRPYIRGLMAEAHEHGTPLLRAMFYQYPDDAACAAIKDQYMFGDRYLVAPVFTPGARSRSVYLPRGVWRNVDTGETQTGGCRVETDAPLDVIPVFELVNMHDCEVRIMNITRKNAANFCLRLAWDTPLSSTIDVTYGCDARGEHKAVLRVSPDGVGMVWITPDGETVLKRSPEVPDGRLTLTRRGSYARVLYDGHELWLQGGTGEWNGHYMAQRADVIIHDESDALTACDYTPLPWLMPPDAPVVPCGPAGSYMEQQVIAGAILAHEGVYYMYTMCGVRGDEEGAKGRVTGLCTSRDLIHWQTEEQPLINLGELNVQHDNLYPGACFRRPDGTFVLLMAVQKFPLWVGICAFTAPHPAGPFTPCKQNPVLTLDTHHHEFDVAEGDFAQGRYMMLLSVYTEDEQAGRRGDRGVRFFSDDLLSWRRDEQNLIFDPETSDGWDAVHVRPRSLTYLDGLWYLWYEGVNHWAPPSFSEETLGFVNKEWWDTVGLARTADFKTWSYYPLNPCLTQSGIAAARYDSTWVGWPRMVIRDRMCYIFHSASGETVSVGCRTIPLDQLTDWSSETRDTVHLL